MGPDLVEYVFPEVKIVDVAHYHQKVDELANVVKDFRPTTLIIDWCHSRDGYTARKLQEFGIFSQTMLEQDLYLLTGRGQIKLGNEQTDFLDKIKKKMKDSETGNGMLVFLYGPAGSDKTVLGLEAGRILRSHRMIKHERNVKLTVCVTGIMARDLLETLTSRFVFQFFAN